ncbi:MAG TPA: hypothetical protein VFB21_23085 [Chthonomonadaceae bacterium]|nr:hypothetical protein [Chthonomonadaceae bacterium]
MAEFARTLTLEELKAKAVLFWPKEIIDREASVTILPLLLGSQDLFISVLNLSDADPEAWRRSVDLSPNMPANLFLKHLMVLTDFGGEALSKITPFDTYFPKGVMEYAWREQTFRYTFKAFVGSNSRLSNSALRVDGKSLARGYALNDKMEDVIMLLLYAASSLGDSLPEALKEKCLVGSLIGRPDELSRFVKQNYIRISRQLGGAASNAMGQIAQQFVMEILREELPQWRIQSGKIPGISHNAGKTETSFDIVAVSPNDLYFGIEVSFQFTTNSVIERKAREAQARADLLHAAGHYICYVIDGAGNINIRENAVRTICQFSDCTVAYSPAEIRHLAKFLRVTAND